MEILYREPVYLWYYFSVQFEQIFPYWSLGMLLGSAVSVFLKDRIHSAFRSLGKKKLGVPGILAASILGAASPLCMYGTIPIAASFSRSGIKDDWLAAFMMSSVLLDPQLIVYSTALGQTALLVRIGSCLLCGVLAGLLVRLFYRDKPFFDFSGFSSLPASHFRLTSRCGAGIMKIQHKIRANGFLAIRICLLWDHERICSSLRKGETALTIPYRLLAVDDEPDIQRTNKKYLESRGYQVDTAACAHDALILLGKNSYDCILLDVLLPDLNGFKLCEAVRALTSAPILFLSCMDDEENKVEGLMAGGDDYITKPYSLKELAARVYAQVRRSAMKGFSIDHDQQILTVNGRVILLAQKEFDLFSYLLGNPGRVLTTREIYREVWHSKKPDATNTVAVYIARLRRKLEGALGSIETVRGEGYRFLPGTDAEVLL